MYPSKSKAFRLLIGLALIALGGVVLAACGSSSSSSSGSSSSESASTTGGEEAEGTQVDTSSPGGAPKWCGTEPLIFGMQDGGGLNVWSKTSAQEVLKAVHQCPNITEVLEVNAGFNLQSAISGLQGMVAKGAKAITIIPDASGDGASELPGIRSAYQSGVAIVPWGANPGGKAGQDYTAYYDADHKDAGENEAKWMGEQLPEGGNVIFIGGPAGNAPSQQGLEGIIEGLKPYPNVKLVSGEDEWIVGNWEAAATQKALSAALAKYPQIDGIFLDEGVAATGAIQALQAANRPLVPIASLEVNALACDWEELSPKNPGFQLATVSAQNFVGRIAAQRAIAEAEGVEMSEEEELSPVELVPDPLIEESTNPKKQPKCDPSKSPSALLSNEMSDAELKKFTRGETD